MQESKLYVGNLNYAVTEAQLEELFAPYGDVRSVKIVEGRGFGFVEMATPEEAEQAKEALNEALFQGRSLKIDEARAPKPREFNDGPRGGGRGGSRGGGGGRGGSRGSRSGGGRGGSRDGGGYRRDYY